MKSIQVNIKKIHKDAKRPIRGSQNALCYDLYCVKDDDFDEVYDEYNKRHLQYLTLLPGKSHIFHTGIIMEFPKNWSCLLWDRSGMGAKRNIHRLAGVIDNDYLGEILVCLINLSQEPQTIYAGDKIIQAHFVENTNVDFVEVNTVNNTERGANGFGSTGQ
jgi:dUTP pyrophosphatase